MQRARAEGQRQARAQPGEEVSLGGREGRDGLYFALGRLGVGADREGVGCGAAEGGVGLGLEGGDGGRFRWRRQLGGVASSRCRRRGYEARSGERGVSAGCGP